MVSVSLARISSTQVRYQYTIENERGAQDPIGKFSLVVPLGIPDLWFYDFPNNGGASWGGPGLHAGNGPAFAVYDIFEKPAGRYMMWFYQGDNVIQPGMSLGGFELQSSYLPGLTTAWFSAGRLPEFDQSWPQEIFQQLAFIEQPRWRDVSVVTIGPMFPPQTPRAVLIETFRQDLQLMIKSGWLDGSSAFVQDVLGIIAELGQRSAAQLFMKSRPQTKTETAVALAIEESLQVPRASGSAPTPK